MKTGITSLKIPSNFWAHCRVPTPKRDTVSLAKILYCCCKNIRGFSRGRFEKLYSAKDRPFMTLEQTN